MANTEKTLGEVIQEARGTSQRSLRDVARALDLSPSYLSDIENDRRVPSTDVLKNIATLLQLDFDDLMALAGRFGEEADRYMKRHPVAGLLFRQITETNLSDQELRKLLKEVQDLAERRKQEE
jgi:transcriptional regulator with XRE-family HTH domain